MTVRDAHKSLAPDTKYSTFSIKRSQRQGYEDGTYDADTGHSPITRWITRAFSYEDAVSKGASVIEVHVPVPRGAIVVRVMARLDTAFDGAGTDDVDFGDGNDGNGWGDAFDFTTDTTDNAIIFYDDDAAYNTGDAVAGTSGPQYYPDGDTVDVTWTGSVGKAGRALLLIETISYCEDQNREWA